jgi:CRP-like cAMP-binding protein
LSTIKKQAEAEKYLCDHLVTPTDYVFTKEGIELLIPFMNGVANQGGLVGEVAMTYFDDKNRNKRIYAAVAQTDMVIVACLNRTIFDILLTEREKKRREDLGIFLYRQLPGVNHNYTLSKITAHVRLICETKVIVKGEILLQEGGESDRIYMIQEGEVSFFKRIPRQTFVDKNSYKEVKLLNLGYGDIFGEDKLLFKCPNRVTAKITSIKAKIVSIKIADFSHFFKRILGDLEKNIRLRHQLLQRQLNNARGNFK